jgi:hypothetical protein
LHGQEAICPIGDSFDDPALDELEVWVCSPENVSACFGLDMPRCCIVDTSDMFPLPNVSLGY